jgi:peroxin-2
MGLSGASGGIIGSAQTDITNPYETVPCGCIYCFVCIAQKIESEEGQGWTCLRCGETVKQCTPWSGDVLQEEVATRPAHGKSVVFAEADDTQTPTMMEDERSDTTEKPEIVSPLQDLDSDGTMQESSLWSTIERESTDNTNVDSDTETVK